MIPKEVQIRVFRNKNCILSNHILPSSRFKILLGILIKIKEIMQTFITTGADQIS